MRCEVCGRKIRTDPTRALIEGAILTVCFECSKHGKKISDEEVNRKSNLLKKPPTPFVIKSVRKRKIEAKVELTQELVSDYASQIRKAREKLNLSHEDLGKKISVKASVLSKLETGKIEPTNKLVSKLEFSLKLKLLIPILKDEIPSGFSKSSNRKVTMGDLIQLNKKGGEEPTERKAS